MPFCILLQPQDLFLFQQVQDQKQNVPLHFQYFLGRQQRRCYRCGDPVQELVDPSDVLGGSSGVCQDCRLTLGAEEVARKWHLMHPELPCVPIGEVKPALSGGMLIFLEPEMLTNVPPIAAAIPREMPAGPAPACQACGAAMSAAGDVWQCPDEACRNFQPISPAQSEPVVNQPDNKNHHA